MSSETTKATKRVREEDTLGSDDYEKIADCVIEGLDAVGYNNLRDCAQKLKRRVMWLQRPRRVCDIANKDEEIAALHSRFAKEVEVFTRRISELEGESFESKSRISELEDESFEFENEMMDAVRQIVVVRKKLRGLRTSDSVHSVLDVTKECQLDLADTMNILTQSSK